MLKKTLLASLVLVASSGAAFANGGSFMPAPVSNCHNCPFFLTFGLGYSWSTGSDIHVRNFDNFNGDTRWRNVDLDNSELWTGGFGYAFSPIFSAQVEVTHRPSLDPSFGQHFDGALFFDDNGDNSGRLFEFSNTSIMLNGLVHLGAWYNHFMWDVSSDTTVQPLLGAGLGVSYNKVDNFRTSAFSGPSGIFIHNGAGRTNTEFAWQLMAGATVSVGPHSSVDVGYRYFDGGDFSFVSHHTATSFLDGSTNSGFHRWSGEFKANEAFVNLNYTFST